MRGRAILGPRAWGLFPQGCPGAQRGAETSPRDIRCIRPKSVSPIGRARTIAQSSAVGSPAPSPRPPRSALGFPDPIPASVSSGFLAPEAQSLHWAGRGRYPGRFGGAKIP